MIGRLDDEAAMATDAYIDLLLDRHGRAEATGAHQQRLPSDLRRTLEVLHAGLPRFHPSFAFEEELADRLRAHSAVADALRADIVRLRIDTPADLARRLDRRVLLGVGGAAIASGVSVAAVYAWRQAARRSRTQREVPA